MMSDSGTLAGILESDEELIPVEICGHSRYSFHIRFCDMKNDRRFVEADHFKLSVDAREFELGRCRVFPLAGTFPPEGRLVFIEDVVDISELVGRKRITFSNTGLFNLRLILTQKDRVRQSFKEYSSNLTFELSVYKQYFDDLDRNFLKEPGPVQEHLQQLVIEREGQEFMSFFKDKILELKNITSDYSRDENEAHGFFFRKQIWDFILHSKFMARTNLKPRGYAGDFEMMRMVYENEYMGHTIFSRLMHKYPLQIPAADAVRNRRNVIARILLDDARSKIPGSKGYDVMSVACGPAAELKDIFLEDRSDLNIHYTLLDQDSEAIRVAGNTAQEIESGTGKMLHIKFINDSVRSMLRIKNLTGEWGQFDFVYSMGLFDYLTPPVARAVLGRLFELLKPGGILVVGNFHTDNPDRVFMEYWLDWVLYYRTREEMLALADEIPASRRSVFFEETKCQMFLLLGAPEDGSI